MRALITGTGNMGRALSSALLARGDEVVAMVGRGTARPDPADLAPLDVAFEFSHATSLVANAELAIAAGCRALVIGTTGWAAADETGQAVARRIAESDARAVASPTFSLAAVLFGALAEEAARLFGRFDSYDPYLFEQHRADKADRPSGTALAVARRMLPHLPSKREARLAEGPGAPDPNVLEVVSLRAGSHPGTHAVGFDGPGESLEVRITARDRSAYVAGALLAADWLMGHPEATGISDFGSLVRGTTHLATPVSDDHSKGTRP
jgi:4-hydroxy-tetrahydrodipicolinate reductase